MNELMRVFGNPENFKSSATSESEIYTFTIAGIYNYEYSVGNHYELRMQD